VQVSESLRSEGLLARLDQFLRGLGRVGPPLAALEPDDLGRSLRERLGRLPVLVVLDDLQKASPSLITALHAIGRAAATTGLKLWLLGREVVMPHDLVPEIDRERLPPLSEAEAEAMLEAFDVAAGDRRLLLKECKGNPLYLVLAARSPTAPTRGTDLRQYVLRELLPSLPRLEREALEALGALRQPAPSDSLTRLPIDPRPALAGLRQLDLLSEDASGQVGVHDLVREIIYGALPAERRREIHGELAEAFRPRGEDWRHVTEFLHHLSQAGRREDAVRWLLRNRSRFLDQASAVFARGLNPAATAP
jgi:hypothetical protein